MVHRPPGKKLPVRQSHSLIFRINCHGEKVATLSIAIVFKGQTINDYVEYNHELRRIIINYYKYI